MCNAVTLVWGSLRLTPTKIRHHTFAMLVKNNKTDSDLYSPTITYATVNLILVSSINT